MATVDPSSPPAGTAHGARPVVLVAAATTRAAERAVRHADTLFGEEHEYVSLMARILRRSSTIWRASTGLWRSSSVSTSRTTLAPNPRCCT